VPTRVNSPSDVDLADRDTATSNLTFGTTDLGLFSVLDSVQPGSMPGPSIFRYLNQGQTLGFVQYPHVTSGGMSMPGDAHQHLLERFLGSL
jgi:hypothetical protein